MKKIEFKKTALRIILALMAGVFLSSGVAFGVDTTPPDPPQILSPETHQLDTGPVTFAWTASDPSGIAGYSFTLNGLPDTVVDTIPEGSMTEKRYLHLADTTYYFHVAALDNAGNWSDTFHFKIVVSKIGFLLDDYDDGDELNGFGGTRGPFQNSDGSYCGIPYVYDPAIVFGGTGKSLALNYYLPYPTSWAGMWTRLEGGDLRYYNTVSMWVKGASGGENFKVGLKDNFGNESKVEIANYLTGGASTSWQKITIPFGVFENVQQWGNVENLSITFLQSLDSEGTIYIDNIMFEDVSFAPNSANTWLIDDFNDLNDERNYRLYPQYHGDSRDAGGHGVIILGEPYLHRYVINKTNKAKEIHYEIPGGDDWAWYSSNVWNGVIPLDLEALGLTYLSFRLKREAKPVNYTSCYIEIQYGDDPWPLSYTSDRVNLSDYALETEEWQLVNIPLSHFGDLDTSKVQAVAFNFDYSLPVKTGNLFIDNLQFSKGYGKPESAGEVRIDRETKTLYVGTQPFAVKAVGYQPTSIGCVPPDLIDPDLLAQDPALLERMFDRDFPLLAEMGCNTIRTWGEPGVELMNKADEYGLKVIAGFWMDTSWTRDYSDPFFRALVKQNFTDFVSAYKDSPALLVWALGNENNYPNNPIEPFYTLCNELAQIAYEEEVKDAIIPGSYHPVMIVNGDLYNIGVHEKKADDLGLNYIDIWGANAYHGDFNSVNWTSIPNDWLEVDADSRDRGIDWFELYKEKSFKPLIITEYGSDAFHTTGVSPVIGYEDEDMQADWVRQNTLDIMDASDVCLGGSIMAYSDEWWKYCIWDPWEPAWEEHLRIHDREPGPQWLGEMRLPDDNYPNEEWWGIMKIAPDGTWSPQDKLDDIKPRKVYNTLRLLYEGAKVVEGGESIQAAIDSSSSGDTIYVTDGLFEEEISIKDKDDIRITGDGTDDTAIITNILLENSDSSIENISIQYKEGVTLTYSDDYYADFPFISDAGITSINSGITVRNCIIMPDPDIFGEDKYGKGIQIWNLYGSRDIDPLIENNLILNANAGIYLYSQASGGAISGEIKKNTLDFNNYGIVMRMHKENPAIHHNIITNSQDAIHLTYRSILNDRLQNIRNNCFGIDSFDNVNDILCEELERDVCIKKICRLLSRAGPIRCWNPYGNIDGAPEYIQPYEYPDYIYPPDLDYTPQNPNCTSMGCRLE